MRTKPKCKTTEELLRDEILSQSSQKLSTSSEEDARPKTAISAFSAGPKADDLDGAGPSVLSSTSDATCFAKAGRRTEC